MRSGGAALAIALLVGACGDSGDTDDAASETRITESGATEDDAPGPGDAGEPNGANELHPSISDLPLPAGYTVPFPADAYSADMDERETVVQMVELEQTNDVVAEFLLTELPAAGFTVVDESGGIVDKSEVVAGQAAMIYFENPDGLPGQITVNPIPEPGSGTSLNINFYRAGGYS